MKFRELTIKNPNDLIFGRAPKPVTTRRGLVIGNGTVYPEVNLTVPEGSTINMDTLAHHRKKYADAIEDILTRAVHLNAPGLVIEFETLLEMTMTPVIGTEITKAMNEVCENFYQKYGLKSEIRLTPNDTREFDRPPKMRTGKYINNMLELFDKGSLAGGDLLSIESTGGKEVCDDAILMCDIKEVIFALGILGVRDMKFLWKQIAAIAKKNNKLMGGDTACGFGNTAMVLAEKQYIPKVFAAAVRAATIVRTLVAVEEGAMGPDKDCGYEGPYLKAIAGIPISMEGKTAACAHMSPLGNIASACTDLWSNESVQNIKLLGGMAPTVYFEQLEYDCRLMNRATKKGPKTALDLRNLMVESDAYLDPQALILTPESVIGIASEIVKGTSYLDGTVRGVRKSIDIIEAGLKGKLLELPEKETMWLDRIKSDLDTIPADEDKFISEMISVVDSSKFIPSEYGI